MIKEIFQKKVVNNFDYIVNIVSAYFGNVYKSDFDERSRNTSISLVRSKGVVKVNDDEIYVGEEPVCIKEEGGSQIIVPVSFLEEKHGNVIFTHLILHALFNDSLKDEYEELNEVIVDYMANDIAKILERKNINITMDKDPIYESNSLYSKCFDIVSDYLETNKREVVGNLVNGDASKMFKIDELSCCVTERINSLIYEEVPENKFKK